MGTEISEPTRTHSNQQETERDRKLNLERWRFYSIPFLTLTTLSSDTLLHLLLVDQRGSSAKRQQWPKIDLLEEEDRFVVKADVPGVPKDKLKLSVSEDGITLGFEEEESKE